LRLKRIEYISGHFKKYRLSSSHTLVIFIFYPPLNRPYFLCGFYKNNFISQHEFNKKITK
ncbi:hypothetical protein P2E32_12310, partial [Mannheimia haemolytica]|nr:hypothetical protein [Mannheimia haemolytica]MDW0562480.1 hypothetical protein [Mannheimia haemolytica]